MTRGIDQWGGETSGTDKYRYLDLAALLPRGCFTRPGHLRYCRDGPRSDRRISPESRVYFFRVRT